MRGEGAEGAEGAVPAAIIAAAVIAFVGYVSFQGSSHAVEFAVTSSSAVVVPGQDPGLPQGWQRRAGSGRVLLVAVSWQAGESLGGGTYAVLVDTPPGWRHLGCRPECEWSGDEGVREFGRTLPRRPYPLAATFDAEESGRVTVAFRSLQGRAQAGPVNPTAWLVQTDGDDVLGAKQIPLF